MVIERTKGAGTFVLASDSWFVSNEALRKDRQAGVLAWFVGTNPNLVFDESHFGIVEQPGIAGLMRKYRLHGFAAGLSLLAGLFIWRNALSLVPPYPQETREPYVLCKETAAGFVNLLRRNVAAHEILSVCFEEWTKSLVQGKVHAIARVDKAQAVLEAESARPAREQDPVGTYREICRVLKGTKH